MIRMNRDTLYSSILVDISAGDDGTVTINFGGDPSLPNHLPIMEGWNYGAALPARSADPRRLVDFPGTRNAADGHLIRPIALHQVHQAPQPARPAA